LGKKSKNSPKNKSVIHVSFGVIRKISLFFRNFTPTYFVLKLIKLGLSRLEKKLIRDDVKLIFSTAPNILLLNFKVIPYIINVWDFGHRDLSEFPETSLNGNFEAREYYYARVLPKAFNILVDSLETKNRIRNIYGIQPNKISVIGFSWIMNYRENNSKKPKMIQLPEKFFLYPSNYWLHKNHNMLIELFSQQEILNSNINLICVGSDKGNLDSLKSKIAKITPKPRIHFYEKIELEELNYLYEVCLGILYPSLLGPSNIPPLEALFYKKFSIISDVNSSLEFNSILIKKLDPHDVKSWQKTIMEMVSNSKSQSAAYSFETNISETRIIIQEIFSKFQSVAEILKK
jgi:hypothetical protein